MDGRRSFTIEKVISKGKKRSEKVGGRFISRSPMGAARKAFTQECREASIKGCCTHTIIMRETTQGSKGKYFQYKISKKKLKTPIIMERGGKEFKIKFETKAKSAKLTMIGGKKKE